MENQKKIVVIGLIVCMVGVLLGLVLPWFVYLDLFSVMMGVAVIRGWNSFLVLLPGLISIILAWVALRKDDPKGWFWGTSISAVLTFVCSLLFWFLNRGDDFMLDASPRIGFWVMIISTLGMIGFSLWSLLAPNSWLKESQESAEI